MVTWRDDESLSVAYFYQRKFALLKTKCSDGTSVWFTNYYRVSRVWTSGKPFASYITDEYYHKEFVENINEAEYLVRKLIGTL